jgi:methyl-accepting chemotaxis protein
LSGQTAFSTLDIEKTVQEIVTSVDSSVSEVNGFLEQVMLQVAESTELSQEFKKLIDFFQKQVEAFESVNEDMSKQAESATELQEVLRTLSNASRKTTTSVNQFCREIELLHQSTTSLVEKIDSFTHPSYIQQLAVSENQSASDV